MKNIIFIVLLITFFSSGCSEKETHYTNKFPLKDFFRNPDKTDFRLSPDGKYISFLAPYQNRLNIFVIEEDQKVAVRVTNDLERDIRHYMWAGNDRIIFLQDNLGDENYKLWGVDLDGKNLEKLIGFDSASIRIFDRMPMNPDEILIGINKDDPLRFDPYRLNSHTGEIVKLADGIEDVQFWLLDNNGDIRVAVSNVGKEIIYYYRETPSKPFKVMFRTDFQNDFTPVAFTENNEKLYAISNIGRDTKAVVLFNPATGEEEEVLYENLEYDVYGLEYDYNSKSLLAAVYYSWRREYHFFDPDFEAMYDKIKQKLSRYDINFSYPELNNDKYIVHARSDRSRGAYYLYDQNKDTLKKITDVSPWLIESELSEMEPIKYKASDGLEINGYLTLPRNVEPKNLPLVVTPHGGPSTRDYWKFYPVSQFLASRGYAVLQVNYRGSLGYGRSFQEEGNKEWGGKMQSDIYDGVKWLIEQGIADKSRIGILGFSFGGYSALCAATFYPDTYSAVIAHCGPSNLFTFLESIPPSWENYREMFHIRIGHPKKDSALLYAHSPYFHVDNVKSPIFIAQGRNDPRVDIKEAEQMLEVLQNSGIEVEYMFKDNEGHGFLIEENRIEFFRRSEEFLDKHLKNLTIEN